jgi:hypothetical protein
MHSDRSLAGRTIAGNSNFVAKLAGAIGQAVLKEYGSAREAKSEIKETSRRRRRSASAQP